MAEPVRSIVVDDEPDLRAMIAEYFGKYGFIVSTAGDGASSTLFLRATRRTF